MNAPTVTIRGTNHDMGAQPVQVNVAPEKSEQAARIMRDCGYRTITVDGKEETRRERALSILP